MIRLFTGVLDEIAVVGAHCDDIAIGMGGTLLTLAGRRSGTARAGARACLVAAPTAKSRRRKPSQHSALVPMST